MVNWYFAHSRFGWRASAPPRLSLGLSLFVDKTTSDTFHLFTVVYRNKRMWISGFFVRWTIAKNHRPKRQQLFCPCLDLGFICTGGGWVCWVYVSDHKSMYVFWRSRAISASLAYSTVHDPLLVNLLFIGWCLQPTMRALHFTCRRPFLITQIMCRVVVNSHPHADQQTLKNQSAFNYNNSL